MSQSTVRTWLILFAAGLFWSLRVCYWNLHNEPLFSDMSDFESMAQCIVRDFCFWWNPFFKTYSPPTVPVLRAIQTELFGESLRAWQFFLGTITFCSLVWLKREIEIYTRSWWLAFALFLSVTLSKSSIFWSMKLSREGPAEAFGFLTAAAIMWALRRKSGWSFIAAGMVTMAGVLIRGSALPLLPILSVIIFVSSWSTQRFNSIKLLAYFILGLSVIWGPWIARSYRLYGAPVLLSTQGPYAFFWDLGQVEVTLDSGQKVVTSAVQLQNEAPSTFANDYQASQYANGLAKIWLRDHIHEFPRLIFYRLLRSIEDRDVQLTKVPRDRLFGNRLDWLLLDKSLLLAVIGMFGLILGAIRAPSVFLTLFAVAIIPWLFAAMLVGLARMFEPSITLTIFGNIVLLWVLTDGVNRITRHRA